MVLFLMGSARTLHMTYGIMDRIPPIEDVALGDNLFLRLLGLPNVAVTPSHGHVPIAEFYIFTVNVLAALAA